MLPQTMLKGWEHYKKAKHYAIVSGRSVIWAGKKNVGLQI